MTPVPSRPAGGVPATPPRTAEPRAAASGQPTISVFEKK